MSERGAWARFLFSGVGHYAEQRLGLPRTTVEDRTCLARALRVNPALREAYESGEVGLESALLVRRALGRTPSEPAVERAWVERAKEATIKRLRDEVRLLGRR